MKLSLFKNVLLIAMVSVIAISCGKDDKKKSSRNPYYNYYNPFTGGVTQTPTAYGATAKTNLQNYINAVETKQGLAGYIEVIKLKYSCSTKDFLGIDFLPMSFCNTSEVKDPKYIGIGQSRGLINPKLNDILVTPAGYTEGNVIQYGSIILVEYVNGSNTIQYTVELGRHAVSNPTIKKDTAAQVIENVVYPSI